MSHCPQKDWNEFICLCVKIYCYHTNNHFQAILISKSRYPWALAIALMWFKTWMKNAEKYGENQSVHRFWLIRQSALTPFWTCMLINANWNSKTNGTREGDFYRNKNWNRAAWISSCRFLEFGEIERKDFDLTKNFRFVNQKYVLDGITLKKVSELQITMIMFGLAFFQKKMWCAWYDRQCIT